MLSYGNKSNLWMGFWNPGNPLDFGLEYFKTQMAIALCSGEHTRVLVLGLGIGAIPATLLAVRPAIEVDVVELDPAVIEGHSKHIGSQKDERMCIHLADASEFVRRADRAGRYDLVICDCFEPEGIPPVFHTRSFYEDAIACLKPGGILSVNLVWTLSEAAKIRQHLLQLLDAPYAIFAPEGSNLGVFGRPLLHGIGPLSKQDLIWKALAVDEEMQLPYLVSTQMEEAELL